MPNKKKTEIAIHYRKSGRKKEHIGLTTWGNAPDGKISAELAKLHGESEFEKYRVFQDKPFMSDFDRYILELGETVNDKQ